MPTFYDVATDNVREATQEDMDVLMCALAAYGRLRTAVSEIHVQMLADVVALKASRKPALDPETDRRVEQSEA
jgi:hypothetical protein